MIGWTITYRHKNHPHETTPTLLISRDAVRQQLEFVDSLPWAELVRITEHTSTETRRDIAWQDLPATGEPTPAPPGPDDHRFYRCKSGPYVLRTGDDVRAHRQHVADHCQRGTSPYYGLDPDALQPQEVLITWSCREISREQFSA